MFKNYLINMTILIALFIFATMYVLPRVIRSVKRAAIDTELSKIHKLFWNGTPEDDLYAWYKVRMILLQREGEKEKIEVVNRIIAEMNKESMYGSLFVDPDGELVDIGFVDTEPSDGLTNQTLI